MMNYVGAACPSYASSLSSLHPSRQLALVMITLLLLWRRLRNSLKNKLALSPS
jgi:hypothetical protein